MTGTHISIHVGDSLDQMTRLDAGSVDLIVTSPPYNLGITYRSYNDRRTKDQYLNWTVEWMQLAKRALSDHGSLFLNLGAAPSNPLLPFEIISTIKDLFVLQNTIHWIKSITVETRSGKTISTGHFKPINSERFLNDCHEYIFHLTKTGDTRINRLAVGVPYSDKSNVNRWGHTRGKDKRCRGNTWFIPYETIRCRELQRPHPATFPVDLVINCIKLHGIRPGLTMMDPFLGIGNAAIAAAKMQVEEFIGFEIDAEYCAIARSRVEAEESEERLTSTVETVA